MVNFLSGVLSSTAATLLIWLLLKVLLPHLQDKLFYRGIRVDGIWDIYDVRNRAERQVGQITLVQLGARVTGFSHRVKTREGEPSDRRFRYKGRITGEQLTMLYEDARGEGFDAGSYIFRLHNNYVEMHGMATFHGKKENQIIAEKRVLRKTPSPPVQQ